MNLTEILPLIDNGLLPFAKCGPCDSLNPMNVTHGPIGTILVTCGVCSTVTPSTQLRFFSKSEARDHGWGFEEVSSARTN